MTFITNTNMAQLTRTKAACLAGESPMHAASVAGVLFIVVEWFVKISRIRSRSPRMY